MTEEKRNKLIGLAVVVLLVYAVVHLVIDIIHLVQYTIG